MKAYTICQHYDETERLTGKILRRPTWGDYSFEETRPGFYGNTDLPTDFGKHLVFEWDDSKGVWPDYFSAPCYWTLVSKRLREFLEEMAESPDCYQFIDPVFSPRSIDCSHMGYKLMLVKDVRYAVDLDASGLYIDDRGDLRVSDTGSPRLIIPSYAILKKEEVLGFRHLWRAKEDHTLIMDEEFAAKLEQQSFEGFDVVPRWDCR